MDWYDAKIWLLQTLELDKDALHIYAAVSVQLLTAILFRQSLASPLPWIAALTIAVVNEYFDYQGVGPSEESIAYYRAAAWHDLWNTMLLPSLLFLLARFWPTIFSNRLTKYPAHRTDLNDDMSSHPD